MNAQHQVVIGGWHYGFQKIAFIKLLQSTLNVSLRYATECNDHVVEGKRVALQFPDTQVVAAFVVAARATGAICDIAMEPYQIMAGHYAIIDQQGACGVEAGLWKRRSTLKREADEQQGAGK